LNNSVKSICIAVSVLSLAMAVTAQTRKPAPRPAPTSSYKPNPAERSLVGINLYDTGTRLVKVYGTPHSIEAIGIGGGGAGGGGATGNRGGMPAIGPGGPGGGRTGGGGGAGGAAPTSVDWIIPGDRGLIGDPFQEGVRGWNQIGVAPEPGGPGGGGTRSGPMAGPGGRGGPMPGAGPAAGGGAPTGGGSGDKVVFTRWVYNQGAGKYGFIMDKQNRVVQIEAIGLDDKKVRTSKGIGFGATFKDLILKYGPPDGYEINGDNIMVRYLVKNKVAFKLTRVRPNGPQVVTGVVVAAGKS
jgi:hypothetical protein